MVLSLLVFHSLIPVVLSGSWAVDCLVNSASVGWWVAEGNRDGLGEKVEINIKSFDKEQGVAVHT